MVIHLTNEIVCVEKCNGYTVATLMGKKQLIMECSLEIVEKHLPANTFARVHKGFLVNIAKIIEIVIKKNSQTIILTNGRTIPLAKRKKRHLLNKLRRDSIIV